MFRQASLGATVGTGCHLSDVSILNSKLTFSQNQSELSVLFRLAQEHGKGMLH